jgi:hypothetical protein
VVIGLHLYIKLRDRIEEGLRLVLNGKNEPIEGADQTKIL